MILFENVFDVDKLDFVKFEEINSQYEATLINIKGLARISGVGGSKIEALNNLHANLV